MCRRAHAQMLCTTLLCLAVLVGLSNELWTLSATSQVHLLLPFAVGTALAVCHLVMVPIGECGFNMY
jgi:hypothetical protein